MKVTDKNIDLLFDLIEGKLVDRYDLGEVPKPRIWYRYKNWSILNSGELHKTNPNSEMREYFKFWEAMSLDDKREIIRAGTLKELIDKIKKYKKNQI